MKSADTKGTFEHFRRDRALASWLTNTRPYTARKVNLESQITKKTHSLEKVKKLNRRVRMVTRSSYVGLRFGKMYLRTLYLRVHADPSFASKDDLTSKLGYLFHYFMIKMGAIFSIMQAASPNSW